MMRMGLKRMMDASLYTGHLESIYQLPCLLTSAPMSALSLTRCHSSPSMNVTSPYEHHSGIRPIDSVGAHICPHRVVQERMEGRGKCRRSPTMFCGRAGSIFGGTTCLG
ncbi:hypothetical protein HBH92_067300 [Parastagonospora nodorum]|nr:hypothetical protein HBH43_110720 [Parastagonospora nodorum]KAH4416028.1 hypothetical protein HBH92_067300 [Parastagonospora nodorum]KAH4444158.1 hypothetical protein HBH93_066180 [Parastagonospora nodorum]KAH4456429.1 hypothetical protein HBH91_097900 [Parastagonospora nodorum]KAH4493469.1 hypothetical protein HBH89_160360 [Parastagonospora nodorum]